MPEVIKGSMTLLIFQLTMFLLITDSLYAFLNFFLLRVYFLKLTLPFNIHHFVVLLFAFLHVFKSIIQIFFIVSTILHWRGKSFFLIEKHLVKHQGIFSKKDKTYDLNNIRSVTVKQSLMGKLFHFGDAGRHFSFDRLWCRCQGRRFYITAAS